jgi:hypothetical protein
MSDNLTIAYLAIGAHNTIRRRDGLPPDYCGGELELISQVINYNTWLDNYYADHFAEEGWGGVWVYDVVEPMGEWLAEQYYTKQREISPSTWLETLIRRYG